MVAETIMLGRFQMYFSLMKSIMSLMQMKVLMEYSLSKESIKLDILALMVPVF